MEKEKREVRNYLQSHFIGKGFQDLNDDVIDKNNCVLCGTCTTLCPRIEIEGKEPVLLENDPECSTCFRYCPKTYFPEEMFEKELFNGNTNRSHSLGFYQELLAAKSTDVDVLKRAQNGGVVSSLLIHALDTELIDGVLLVDKDENWAPKPVIARNAKEILSCMGSKYTIAPTLNTYKDAVYDFKLKNLALVGMPCQVQAARKLQLYSPLSEELGEFKLIIGLYCFSNYSYDLIQELVQEELEISLTNVKKFDVSNNKFYIYLNDGTVKAVPIGRTKKYTWLSCLHCKDFSSEIADISIGSSGALRNDWNSVLLRTDFGYKFFYEAIKARKIISSKEVDFVKLEKTALKKKMRTRKIDQKILYSLQMLDMPDFDIKTYTTLMSLGNVNELLLAKVMKKETNLILEALNKLKQRGWVMNTNGSYSSVNPKVVINNEINNLRKNLNNKIETLKFEVLPNLETLYVQNNVNRVRHREELDSN